MVDWLVKENPRRQTSDSMGMCFYMCIHKSNTITDFIVFDSFSDDIQLHTGGFFYTVLTLGIMKFCPGTNLYPSNVSSSLFQYDLILPRNQVIPTIGIFSLMEHLCPYVSPYCYTSMCDSSTSTLISLCRCWVPFVS